MTIAVDSHVGKIATEHPLATRVFHRHGIDFCCGGGKPLSEACANKGIDAHAVVEEIEKELNTATVPSERWDNAPLMDLIQHILTDFHEPLREELGRIDVMTKKVVAAHGTKDASLAELRQECDHLGAELLQHMAKEEQILFPMIQSGDGMMAHGPISVMQHEHEDAGAALARIRALTNDYQVPAEACNTWRSLWAALEALEKSLHEHIHLENNILFPRTLQT